MDRPPSPGALVVTSSVTIRAATSADADALSALAHRTFVATYADDNPPGLVAAHADEIFTPQRQADELVDPTVTYRVAESDGALVGYCMVAATDVPDAVTRLDPPSASPLQLSRLYVDAHAKGTGVGTALVGAAVEVATAHDHDLLWLTVWTRNPRAIAAYTRWGFADVGTTIFDMAGDRQVDRVMVLRVPGAPATLRPGDEEEPR